MTPVEPEAGLAIPLTSYRDANFDLIHWHFRLHRNFSNRIFRSTMK